MGISIVQAVTAAIEFDLRMDKSFPSTVEAGHNLRATGDRWFNLMRPSWTTAQVRAHRLARDADCKSNIHQLRREAVAARACGWHYGPDTLPLRQDDPTSLQADALAEVNVCPFHDPKCVDFCVRPQVCGSEPS